MQNLTTLTLTGAMALVLCGCARQPDPQDGARARAATTAAAPASGVAVPAKFIEALKQCEEQSNKIAILIDADRLLEVHAAAEPIKHIAETLPAIAKVELAPQALGVVTAKAGALAGTFAEIDRVADAEKKAETIKVHEKIRALIEDLQEQAAAHAKTP